MITKRLAAVVALAALAPLSLYASGGRGPSGYAGGGAAGPPPAPRANRGRATAAPIRATSLRVAVSGGWVSRQKAKSSPAPTDS